MLEINGNTFLPQSFVRNTAQNAIFSIYYAKELFLMACNINSITLHQNSPCRENINNPCNSKILRENLQVINKSMNIIYYIYYITNKE